MQTAVLVIGIGNEYRRDDGVGIRIARQIDERHLPGVIVVEQTGDGAALMDAWKDAHRVYLIDAVCSGAAPGTVHRLDAHKQPIPMRFFCYSTHAFSVAEAVEMARTLEELPPELVVFGVEGGCFDAGVGLSPEVARAADQVIELVIREITEEVR